ncbi:YtxH domain-containing protein [Hymenobacter glacialis]|nr:YtxH domain-containing protein [Hymenobacter glacialis]
MRQPKHVLYNFTGLPAVEPSDPYSHFLIPTTMASKTTTGILCFAGGALTGAALGLLYAPEPGTETRSWLSYQLERYRSVLADLTDSLVTSREASGQSSAKSEGQRVISDAKSKAEQLLGDVDQLINQINSRKGI